MVVDEHNPREQINPSKICLTPPCSGPDLVRMMFIYAARAYLT